MNGEMSESEPAVEGRTLRNVAAVALVVGAVAYLTASLRLYDLIAFPGAHFVVVEFVFFVLPIPAMWIASAVVGLRSERYIAFAAGIAVGLAVWGIATSLGAGSAAGAAGGLLLLVASARPHAERALEIAEATSAPD